MTHLLAPLLGLDDGFGSNAAYSLLALAKKAGYDNVLPIAIRMVLVGALIAGLRRGLYASFSWLDRNLYPTAYIAVSDSSYLWVMAWLAQDPAAQSQIKDFQLSTSECRDSRQDSGNLLQVETLRSGTVAPGSSTVGGHNASWTAKDIIGQVTPTYHQTIRIKHGKSYIWITRKVASFACSQARMVDHVQIRTSVWQKSALKDFLSAAHHRYFTKQDSELLIFHPGSQFPDRLDPGRRSSYPAQSRRTSCDIEKFLSEKEMSWYAARGIPHRRGYLFHGSPGSGKTTLATAIASTLHLNVYVINPSQRGMDDAKLSKLFRNCPVRSIILIEDIDCIFPSNQGRGTLLVSTDEDGATLDGNPAEAATSTPAVTTGNHDLAPSTVTLSGLLNAIDGVSSQEGCILIASTNHPEHLDPALLRPGRFDVQIPFFHATPGQAAGLFKHFYPLSDLTPADTFDKKEQITSNARLEELAAQFADAVFPSDVDASGTAEESKSASDISMAALQGFLLGYKDDPFAAFQGARLWAEGHSEPEAPSKVVLALAPTPAASGKAKGTVKKRVAAPASPTVVSTPMSAGTV